MPIVFYISGHGFGHAARTIEMVNAVLRMEPDTRVVLRTAVPEWFLRASLEARVEILPGDTDTGVMQPDSLSIDEDETARRAAAFYACFDARVSRERDVLRATGATLVVGDIPPVAFAAAHAAGVPSVAVSNFTWDWIYGGFPDFDAAASGVRQQIADANALATVALRLPFWGGFTGMRYVEDVPLVARRAAVTRSDTRARLALPDDRPLVLATFGGHGGNVPLGEAAGNATFTVVATDYEAGTGTSPHPNLRVVPARDLARAGLVYTDLLAACDVVVTKLGYGIVSECIANDVALLYALRGRFVEQDVFMRQMPAVLRCRQIGTDNVRTGTWAADVTALLAQPAPAGTMRVDGAEVVARRLLDMVATGRQRPDAL